ncbi:MAG: GNAT family N-acetyltransferase, partial [Actinobacteria bacterium]|nr:GNAT family N-acetyltransferase [Actinomycetota bacterium]
PWGEDQFRLPLPGKHDHSLVGMSEDHVVAFWIASLRSPDVLYTHRVAVDARMRGSGLGTSLLFEVLEGARAAGCRLLALSVNVRNGPAARFYERHGFARTQPEEAAAILSAGSPGAAPREGDRKANTVYALAI